MKKPSMWGTKDVPLCASCKIEYVSGAHARQQEIADWIKSLPSDDPAV